MSSGRGWSRNRRLHAALGLIAALFSAPGSAQEPTQTRGAGLEEVIVTAQRRAERSLDVPLSVTSLSAEQLIGSGIATSRDLGSVVPGLRIEATGVYVQPAIRGVTTTLVGPGSDTNVATYIDGVYQGNQTHAVFELPDIQRVEVLKGPQGTLFGRNATGGAIQLFTQEPSFTPTGRINVGYGRFDDVSAKAFVSGPLIGDKLAGSLSAYYRDYEGYQEDLLRGGKRTGGMETRLARAKLLYEPTASVSLELSGLYSQVEDAGALQNTNLNGNNVSRAIVPGIVIASDPHEVSQNDPALVDMDSAQYSLRATVDLGLGELTSLTAYHEVEADNLSDGDGSALPLVRFALQTFSRAVSEELTFSSKPFGPLQVVAGLFFYDRTAGFNPVHVVQPTSTLDVFTRDENQAFALFSELEYDITQRLSAIAGVRVNREKIESQAGLGTLQPLGEKTYTSTTPRFSLAYSWNDSTKTYMTYTEGFKSGLFNSQSLAPEPVKPETIDAYEVGVKFEPRDVPLRFNGAVFFNDYQDLQVAALNRAPDGRLFTLLQNAASVEGYGVDAELTWNPLEPLSLRLGVNYLHAEYTAFPNASVNHPRPAPLPQNIGNVQDAIDAEGKKTIRSPEWSFNAMIGYSREFAVGTLGWSTNAYYSSRVFFDPENRLTQDPYVLVNARATWSPPASRFTLGIWGRNLADEDVIGSTTIQATGDHVLYLPPRSYGVELGYEF